MKIKINAPASIPKLDEGKKEMLTIHTVDNHTTVYINPSSLSEMQGCWRKAHYALNLGMKPHGESIALVYGIAIHKALEVFYTSKPKERNLTSKVEDFFDLLEYDPKSEGHEENVLVEAVRQFVVAAEPLRALDSSQSRCIKAGIWTLKHYFRTYLDDPFVAMEDADGPMIERRVEYPIYESDTLTIIVHGTIDVILKNTQTGNVVICDHKTTGRLSMDFYNRLKPNHQYTAYVWGAQRCLGVDSSVFVVNGIEVKAMPKTARGSAPKFIRQPTNRTEEDFEEFRDTVVGYVKAHLDRKRSGVWELGSTNSCAMWGGCKFLDVCSSPKAIRQSIISNKYELDCYAKRPMPESAQLELPGVLDD